MQPQADRRSTLKDGNGQLCLENRDLDCVPEKDLGEIDSWLEKTVDDFDAAACFMASLLLLLGTLKIQAAQLCHAADQSIACVHIWLCISQPDVGAPVSKANLGPAGDFCDIAALQYAYQTLFFIHAA